MVRQQTRRGSSPASTTSEVASAMRQPTEMVKEYPISSMLVVFGVGLGVGVLLAQAVADPMIRSFSHEPTMMERLGQQGRNWYDSLHSHMPEALARRMPA